MIFILSSSLGAGGTMGLKATIVTSAWRISAGAARTLAIAALYSRPALATPFAPQLSRIIDASPPDPAAIPGHSIAGATITFYSDPGCTVAAGISPVEVEYTNFFQA